MDSRCRLFHLLLIGVACLAYLDIVQSGPSISVGKGTLNDRSTVRQGDVKGSGRFPSSLFDPISFPCSDVLKSQQSQKLLRMQRLLSEGVADATAQHGGVGKEYGSAAKSLETILSDVRQQISNFDSSSLQLQCEGGGRTVEESLNPPAPTPSTPQEDITFRPSCTEYTLTMGTGSEDRIRRISTSHFGDTFFAFTGGSSAVELQSTAEAGNVASRFSSSFTTNKDDTVIYVGLNTTGEVMWMRGIDADGDESSDGLVMYHSRTWQNMTKYTNHDEYLADSLIIVGGDTSSDFVCNSGSGSIAGTTLDCWDGQDTYLLALNAKTGNVEWGHLIGSHTDKDYDEFDRMAIAGDIVVVTGRAGSQAEIKIAGQTVPHAASSDSSHKDGYVAGFNARTGAIVWVTRLMSEEVEVKTVSVSDDSSQVCLGGAFKANNFYFKPHLVAGGGSTAQKSFSSITTSKKTGFYGCFDTATGELLQGGAVKHNSVTNKNVNVDRVIAGMRDDVFVLSDTAMRDIKIGTSSTINLWKTSSSSDYPDITYVARMTKSSSSTDSDLASFFYVGDMNSLAEDCKFSSSSFLPLSSLLTPSGGGDDVDYLYITGGINNRGDMMWNDEGNGGHQLLYSSQSSADEDGAYLLRLKIDYTADTITPDSNYGFRFSGSDSSKAEEIAPYYTRGWHDEVSDYSSSYDDQKYGVMTAWEYKGDSYDWFPSISTSQLANIALLALRSNVGIVSDSRFNTANSEQFVMLEYYNSPDTSPDRLEMALGPSRGDIVTAIQTREFSGAYALGVSPPFRSGVQSNDDETVLTRRCRKSNFDIVE